MFLCFSSKPSTQPKTLISVQILQSNQLTCQRYPYMSWGALTIVWDALDNQSISLKIKIFYSFQAFSILNRSISINDNSTLTCSTNPHLQVAPINLADRICGFLRHLNWSQSTWIYFIWLRLVWQFQNGVNQLCG